MHIEKFLHNSKPYLRLVASKRMTTRNGKSISGKQLILSLGALEKHDDGKPDYLARLRESFRAGKPLIKALEPYVGQAPKNRVLVPFEEGDKACRGKAKRMAPVILDPVLRDLGLDELFTQIKTHSRIGYDLLGIVRLLVYGRLLEPASKSATMEQSDSYYKPLVRSDNDDNVYDALDVIDANAEKIIRKMDKSITKGTGRHVENVFYDVTNFFFEIERPDGDLVDESGRVLEKGFRKMGVSKENRRQPIVQLGLFLDSDGIPITFKAFPGNTLDRHTLRPAMVETLDKLGLSRYILVADRGMYTGTNMLHVLDTGNGYIVSKSLRGSSREAKQWALNQTGYDCPDADFRCKSHVVDTEVKDEDGKTRTLRQKVVVYWSRNYYNRERHENESFLAFIEEFKKHPERFRLSAAQSQSLRRFLKKDVLNKKNGEILDGTKLVAQIDEEKLKEFNDLMGYYQIVTSELKMPDREVIAKYHGLTRIEDQFREMKSTLETRPVYVRTKEHIRAHLMVCFIALTMMRLIQRKTKNANPPVGEEDGKHWTYGIPGERLTKALRTWQSVEMPQQYYMMLGSGNEDLDSILAAFGIELKNKAYTKGDIRALKASVGAF